MRCALELNAFLDADFAWLGDDVTAQPKLRFLNSAMGALEAPHQRFWRCSVEWEITGSKPEQVSLEHRRFFLTLFVPAESDLMKVRAAQSPADLFIRTARPHQQSLNFAALRGSSSSEYEAGLAVKSSFSFSPMLGELFGPESSTASWSFSFGCGFMRY